MENGEQKFLVKLEKFRVEHPDIYYAGVTMTEEERSKVDFTSVGSTIFSTMPYYVGYVRQPIVLKMDERMLSLCRRKFILAFIKDSPVKSLLVLKKALGNSCESNMDMLIAAANWMAFKRDQKEWNPWIVDLVVTPSPQNRKDNLLVEMMELVLNTDKEGLGHGKNVYDCICYCPTCIDNKVADLEYLTTWSPEPEFLPVVIPWMEARQSYAEELHTQLTSGTHDSLEAIVKRLTVDAGYRQDVFVDAVQFSPERWKKAMLRARDAVVGKKNPVLAAAETLFRKYHRLDFQAKRRTFVCFAQMCPILQFGILKAAAYIATVTSPTEYDATSNAFPTSADIEVIQAFLTGQTYTFNPHYIPSYWDAKKYNCGPIEPSHVQVRETVNPHLPSKNVDNDVYKISNKPRGKALIIYNNFWNSYADLNCLKELLVQLYIKVYVVENIHTEDIIKEIRKFKQLLDANTDDIVMVFATGHGDINYLQMIDGGLLHIEAGLLEEFSDEKLNAFRDKPKIIVIDACRNMSTDQNQQSPNSVPKELPKKFGNKNHMFVLLSCQPGNISTIHVDTFLDADSTLSNGVVLPKGSPVKGVGSLLLYTFVQVVQDHAMDSEFLVLCNMIAKEMEHLEPPSQNIETKYFGLKKKLYLNPGYFDGRPLQ